MRADGAFIPFAEDFNMNNVITTVKGVGEIGDVNIIDLQSPINSLIGRQVVKVGRSSGLDSLNQQLHVDLLENQLLYFLIGF